MENVIEKVVEKMEEGVSGEAVAEGQSGGSRMYMMVYTEEGKRRMSEMMPWLVWCEVVGVNVEGQPYVLMGNPRVVEEKRESGDGDGISEKK